MDKDQKTSFKDLRGIMIALIAGVCAIACVFIGISGLTKYKQRSEGGITATGSASCDFESDLIVWRGSFSTSGVSMSTAYNAIKRDAELTKAYLLDNGIKEEEIVFNSVSINKEYNSIYDDFGNYLYDELTGYSMYQDVTVTSSDIDKVEQISRDSSALIDSGVEFASDSPEYYYTKLDELKLQLIKDATENAKSRIDIVAEGTGCKPGELVNANLGVFQITAQNSSADDYSYGGTFNTYSRDKTATITVKLNYTTR